MTNKYDELLIDGLSKLKELEFSNIPEADEIDYTFSDGYIKYKDKLLNKLGHSYWKFVNTVAKKAAVIIIALIISFSSLMTVDAFREKFVKFLYTVYTNFTQIESKNNDNEKYFTRNYSLNNIPNGYIKVFNESNKHSTVYYWKNINNQLIMLTQISILNSNQFNTEHGTLKETTINDTPCLTCKTNTDYFCYWEFDGYRFELIYPIALGEQFMSEVVGNLVEIDPTELEN